MTVEILLAVVAGALAILFRWGFSRLPHESWQVIASVPREKAPDGRWRSVNFTYYGFFVATAYGFGTAVFFFLMGAVQVPAAGSFLLATGLLVPSIVSSKVVAWVVEKKRYTFSVAGAAFVGMLITPPVILAADATVGRWMGFDLRPMTVLAALAIGYAFGEGVGRLACISYGCCYGKPLTEVHPLLRALFQRCCFVFTGKTKKIAYADGYDGCRVVPIQAMTAVLYCLSGLAGTLLFFKGYVTAAFFEALIVTQGWRFLSEFLRADFRGGGRITAYQIMGLVGIAYAVAVAFFLPNPAGRPADLSAGLGALWSPAVILFLQALWIATFLMKGRSRVTGATLTLHVHEDRI